MSDKYHFGNKIKFPIFGRFFNINPFRLKRLRNSFFIRFFILLLFTGLNILNLFAESKPLVREVKIYRPDSVFRHTYYFDEFKNKVVENKFLIENNASIPLTRTEWIYDGLNCISQRESKWINGVWLSYYKITSEYSGNNKIKEEFISVTNGNDKTEKTIITSYSGDKVSQVITYKGKQSDNLILKSDVYDYSSNKKIIQDVSGINSGDSVSHFRYIYSYGNDSVLDSLLLSEVQNGTGSPLQLSTYFYDQSTGNLKSQVLKNWNSKSLRWENFTKCEYVYNNSNSINKEIYYQYTTLFWTPVLKYEYQYDSIGHLKSKIHFNSIYDEWRKISTILYSDIRNDQPNLMESRYNFWGGTTGDFSTVFIPYYFNDEITQAKASKIEINYFIDTTVITNFQENGNSIRIYPNPSNGIFYISTQNFYIEGWELYDLSGMLLKKETNKFNSGIIDLTGMPDGVYIVKAKSSENEQLIQKIILNNQ